LGSRSARTATATSTSAPCCAAAAEVDDSGARAPGVGEPSTGEPSTDNQGADDLGARGHLIIKERAAARIVTAAALGVPGVIRHSSGIGRFTGRDLPRAAAMITPRSVSVDVSIAVAWPSPVALIAREVKWAVARNLEHLTGVPVEQVNIVVSALVPVREETAAPDELAASAEPANAVPPIRPARPDARAPR
jgi:uncharacterized alkaline shock family protein YloU